MTDFGLNPSFRTWVSRVPMDNNLLRRGRDFEVFDDRGQPIGELSKLKGKWPEGADGRWNGVRLFGSMGGTVPTGIYDVSAFGASDLRLVGRGVSVIEGEYHVDGDILGDSMLSVQWKGRSTAVKVMAPTNVRAEALRRIKRYAPAYWRTLDHAQANQRPDWLQPRVLPSDPLQGSLRGASLEDQIADAKAIGARLWWNAPPRYELTMAQWRAELIEFFEVLRAKHTHDLFVLQLGNEEWNGGFPFNRWLKEKADATNTQWPVIMAQELTFFWSVARDVLGEQGGRYLTFVGGHIADPWSMVTTLKNLTTKPNMAGPAFYVGPTKDDLTRWGKFDIVPSMDELQASCARRMVELRADLRGAIVSARANNVPLFALYEAGLGMLHGAEPWRETAIRAHATEWAGTIYRDMRSLFAAEGVHAANWYSWNTEQAPSDRRMNVFGLDDGSDVELPKSRGARGLL